jgi:hypothetical protein
MLCVLPMRLHTASSLDQLIRLLEVRGRLCCRMGAALACAVPCGIRSSPSFDRTGSLTTSKQRWLRHPRRVLWLRILRWRFQERVLSRSTSREMWITGCGNYDFWPTAAPADRLCITSLSAACHHPPNCYRTRRVPLAEVVQLQPRGECQARRRNPRRRQRLMRRP